MEKYCGSMVQYIILFVVILTWGLKGFVILLLLSILVLIILVIIVEIRHNRENEKEITK